MEIFEIIRAIEQLAPPELQEDYDNSGLMIGNEKMEISGCLICLDVTEAMIDEAIRRKCGLIISHHPLIFGGLKRLTGKTRTENIVIRAIKEGVAIYAVHTNLDNIASGVNEILGRKLGLSNLKILSKKKGVLKKLVTFCPEDHAEKVREAIFQAGAGHIGEYDYCSFNTEGLGSFRGGEAANPFVGDKGVIHFEREIRIETIFPSWLEQQVVQALLEAHPYEEVAYDIYLLENIFDKAGAGMIGELPDGVPENEFLQKIKDLLHVPVLRHSSLTGKKIKKVAVCGGSGGFLIREAIRQKADIFISADIKYHSFHEVEGIMLVVDAGHYETEQFTCDLIADYLKKKFPNFAFFISDIPVNPVNYF